MSQENTARNLESVFSATTSSVKKIDYLNASFNRHFRSFGGQVSWHSTVAIGATYEESDETITHQIVDRPEVPNQYLSR